ncbi:hypothetical protein DSUL_20072 [Desulfovibrionales bacterium]
MRFWVVFLWINQTDMFIIAMNKYYINVNPIFIPYISTRVPAARFYPYLPRRNLSATRHDHERTYSSKLPYSP